MVWSLSWPTSSLPTQHTKLPTPRRYCRDELLSWNKPTLSPFMDIPTGVSTLPTSVPLELSDRYREATSLCRTVYDAGVHCRRLSCLRKPAKRAHRGRRRRKLTTNCKSSLVSKLAPRMSKTIPTLRAAAFNVQSVVSHQQARKRTEIVQFIIDYNIDIFVLTGDMA